MRLPLCSYCMRNQSYSTSPFTVTEFEAACYVLIAVSLCRTLCMCVCVCLSYCLSLCSVSKWAESSGKHVPTVSTFTILYSFEIVLQGKFCISGLEYLCITVCVVLYMVI